MNKKSFSHYTQYSINFDDWEMTPKGGQGEPGGAQGHASASISGSPDSDESDLAAIGESAPRNPLDYISFGSGSSGNSCYVGTSRGGILIDAGVRVERVEEVLKQHGMSFDQIKGILLTHDHSDHIGYVYKILREHRHIRLYCTNRVLQSILRKHSISKRIKEFHNPIFKEIPFRILDMEITAFDVPHDGADNMGYSLDYAGKRFVLATDLGEVTERARYYMQEANYLVIEANYDLEMLRNGRYPEHLKARIQTSAGHMDNLHTAAFLRDIFSPALQYIFLCHLSLDNNTPEKALAAVRQSLEGAGIKVGTAQDTIEDRACDVQLMALPRFEATRRFIFR